jgi:hypothetical protein
MTVNASFETTAVQSPQSLTGNGSVLVIPGRCAAANPEPMNTDGESLAKLCVHGFPLARE